jgi:hypothetical protein
VSRNSGVAGLGLVRCCNNVDFGAFTQQVLVECLRRVYPLKLLGAANGGVSASLAGAFGG